MANIANFTIPKPPDKPDIAALQRWANDMYSFLINNWQSGLQIPFFSQDQITQMTDLTQAGKLFFNNDTGKAMVGEVATDALSIKTITTA